MWANVADLECRSLSLPASCDLGIDRRQLHRISIRAQPGPARARIAPVSLRVDPGAVLPSGGLRRRGVDAERLPAFWHLYVFAWRLAASHYEHVDSVVVRSAHRGSAGSHEVSRVLFCLRRGRGGDPCGLQRSVHRSRPWRFGSNRWRARMLHAPVSLRAPGRRDPDFLFSVLLRSPRLRLHRAVVPHADDSGRRRIAYAVRGGGIAWWAHVGGFVAGLVLAPVIRQSTRRYRPYYPDEGILGFDPSGRR